jgi:hypothetical protein
MEFLNRVLIVAILIISTTPLYAQRQQQDVAKLKVDARKSIRRITAIYARLAAAPLVAKANEDHVRERIFQLATFTAGSSEAGGIRSPSRLGGSTMRHSTMFTPTDPSFPVLSMVIGSTLRISGAVADIIEPMRMTRSGHQRPNLVLRPRYGTQCARATLNRSRSAFHDEPCNEALVMYDARCVGPD